MLQGRKCARGLDLFPSPMALLNSDGAVKVTFAMVLAGSGAIAEVAGGAIEVRSE